MSAGLVAAEDLLRIDFDAALEKLAWSQLQGTWQLPAELARLAIGCGASAVEIEIEPRRLTMTAPGSHLHPRRIADFASVLDSRLEPADRHRAMVSLEENDAFVLSAIACSPLATLRLQIGGEGGLRVDLTASGELSVTNPSLSTGDQPDLDLDLNGLQIEQERASTWLRRAGRFSRVPISINGGPIDRGLSSALVEKRIVITPPDRRQSASLAAAVSIPRHGSSPRLWLLRHGIIATHATVPGYPAFEAAIEMSPALGDSRAAQGQVGFASGTSGAALRERLSPYIESLVDAAVGLTLSLAGKASVLPEKVRARAGRLLLEAARKRRRLSEVSGAEIFPLLTSEGRRLVSIDVVGRLVRVEDGGACALDAIPPGQDPKRFALVGRGALVISQSERALLGDLLNVVFSNPPIHARQQLGQRLRTWVSERVPALRFARGTVIPETGLSADERSFLESLRAAVEDGGLPAVEFRTGAAKVYRAGDGRLVLPRDNTVVRASVRAVVRDPSWLYPAVVALLAGRQLPGPEVRRGWFASLEDPTT